MSEETTDPDTSTEDQIGDLEIGAPEESVPVADAAPPEAPPAAPAGPRTFPQHYTLLFGAVVVFVSSQTFWERPHVFGQATPGDYMHSGTFLMAMSLYMTVVAILNILQGRLRGMLSAFVTGVAALYFGIKKYMATINQDAFLSREDIEKEVKSIETAQDVWAHWFGQFAPGVWLSILGGAMICWVFLKALFPTGKKAEPAPAPRRRRR